MKEVKVTYPELQRRLGFSLREKIKWTIERYLDFIEVLRLDSVYISFSGGKDSQVLADIIERLHAGKMMEFLEYEYLFFYNKFIKDKPSPPKVFSNTGLEFPEIVAHVKNFDNVFILRPKRSWFDVVKNVGFLIGSKKTSRMIKDIRTPTTRNQATRTLYLTGIKKDGSKSKSFKLAKKWHKLINAPFKISDKCCDIFKKEPFKEYEKKTNKKPIIATMVGEADMRRVSYMYSGCNNFSGKINSKPMSIWTQENVWEYAKLYSIHFADVYYDRKIEGVNVPAESRTGCMFCQIGDKETISKRIDRLAISHPKIHKNLIQKIEINKILEYI